MSIKETIEKTTEQLNQCIESYLKSFIKSNNITQDEFIKHFVIVTKNVWTEPTGSLFDGSEAFTAKLDFQMQLINVQENYQWFVERGFRHMINNP